MYTFRESKESMAVAELQANRVVVVWDRYVTVIGPGTNCAEASGSGREPGSGRQGVVH